MTRRVREQLIVAFPADLDEVLTDDVCAAIATWLRARRDDHAGDEVDQLLTLTRAIDAALEAAR